MGGKSDLVILERNGRSIIGQEITVNGQTARVLGTRVGQCRRRGVRRARPTPTRFYLVLFFRPGDGTKAVGRWLREDKLRRGIQRGEGRK